MFFYSFEIAAAGWRVFRPELDVRREVVGPLFYGWGGRLVGGWRVSCCMGGYQEEDGCWEGQEAGGEAHGS